MIALTIALTISVLIIRLLYYNSPNAMGKVSDFFTDRPKYEAEAIIQYGYSLLGREIRWVGVGTQQALNNRLAYNYVDNSFLKLSLTYGIVFSSILLIAIASLLIQLYRNLRIRELIIFCCLIIYSLYNAHLLAVHFQCIILMLSLLFADSGC